GTLTITLQISGDKRVYVDSVIANVGDWFLTRYEKENSQNNPCHYVIHLGCSSGQVGVNEDSVEIEDCDAHFNEYVCFCEEKFPGDIIFMLKLMQ
ncbi:MAG: hypothetical protein ACXABY_07175, partial [Candidatus Thorarchaeota archaeon]